jgi:hypothetical protein
MLRLRYAALSMTAYGSVVHRHEKAAPSELAEGAAFYNAKRGRKLVLLDLFGERGSGAVGPSGGVHAQGSF